MEKNQSIRQHYNIYKQLKQQQGYEYVTRAIDLLIRCIKDSGFQKFYVSFNGGKDATIVLFLTYFAMIQLNIKKSIPCLYFQEPQPFQQTEDFIAYIGNQLEMSIFMLRTKNYQTELKIFQQQHGIDWVVMGTRKDDPGCSKLEEISESDVHKGYPKFKRINPIIDWSYDSVWKFIIDFKIPYCKLYDEGYTYLGNKDNTIKNEHLFDKETKKYKKAFQAPKQVETISRKTLEQSQLKE